MKVGIMTFHASNNCGSMLQAYALQKKIKDELSVESEIINFSNAKQRDMYALFRKVDSLKDLMLNVVTCIFYPIFKRHYNDYSEFKNKHLKLSKKEYFCAEDLKTINDKYDVIIAGSDQVWNILCYDSDDAYYLNFVQNIKKVAFSPSFGATNIINVLGDYTKYKEYLLDFAALSCREENGSKWIEEMTGRKAPVLLDPTLLVSEEEWNELLTNDKKENKFIFYYAFKYSDEVNKVVKRISKESGLPVVIMDAKSWLKKGRKYGFKLSKNSGPLTFLKLIKDSECVLTTSFHGTAFSIIYHKKFAFINSKMHNKDDDRAITLLRTVGLEEKMINCDSITKEEIFKELNYEIVDEKLKIAQKKSIDFLKEMVR